MTVDTDSFPIGYFYIISKLNGMALDIDTSQPIGVSRSFIYVRAFYLLLNCRVDQRLLLL